MDYNTNREKLVLPEYGRIIQRMVDHALTIEDRTERQRCASSIIKVMGSLFPHLRDVPDFTHKLWDHLAIMSGFQLDIDYPYDVAPPKPENVHIEKLPYPTTKIQYRHYGHLLEQSLQDLLTMEEGEQKELAIKRVANQMKHSLALWNKDSVDDVKIVADLARYTNGKIKLDLEKFHFAPLSLSNNPIAQNPSRNMKSRRYKKN
ncbi:MAG: DUF4290 domain-containing protein [Bacteroidaceae bacterium]